MKKILFYLVALAGLAQAETCQITSPLPMPVSITGCSFTTVPGGATSYIQNTLAPTTTTQTYSVQSATATDSLTLPYASGCLYTNTNGKIVGTGLDCATPGSSGKVNISTQNNVGYYSAAGSSTISGSDSFTWNGTTVTTPALAVTTINVTGPIQSALTGLVTSTSTITSTDTIMGAFSKISNSRIVQIVISSASSQFSTTSTAYQSTNLTGSITPTKATNRIWVIAQGVGISVISTNAAFYTIFRGSTDTSGANAGLQSVSWTAGLSELDVPVMMSILDTPNSTSALTYTVKLASKNSGQTVYFGNGLLQTIVMVEIGQ